VESTTVSTYEKRVDDWLVGLLSTQTTTSAVGGSFPPPLPRHVAYEYEERGLLCHVFLEKDDPDPSLPEVLTYTRDDEGLVRAVTASAVGVPPRTTHLAYEPLERVHRSQLWNDLGHAQWFLHASALGVLLVSEDANGVRTQARYDDLGRPIEVVPEGGDPVTIDYDPRLGAGGSVIGLSVLTTLGSGAKTRSDHDELGRPVVRAHRGFDGSWIEEATRYDLLGRPVLQTRPGFGAPSTAAVTRAYDNLDRPTRELRPGNVMTTFVSTFFETHVTDPMGHQRYTVRDIDDRVVTSVQIAAGNDLATSYEYGDFDQIGRVIDPLGNTVASGYDRRGRRWFSDDPDAGTALFTYNGFGDLTSKVINGSAVTLPTYDVLGRVTRVDDEDGITLTVWDTSPHGLGRVAHTESPDGITQDFSYDALARPVGQTWTVDGVPYAMSSSYDTLGRPSSLVYPAIPGKAPFTLGRHYTPTGYLDLVFDAAAPQNEFWHASARNADDALLAGTLGNGISLSRTYDDDTGRLATVNEGPALSLTYDYDFDGEVHHKRNLLASRLDTYSYDALHRLDGWTLAAFAPGPPGFPEVISKIHQTVYSYDRLGNLITMTRDGSLQDQNVYGEDGRPHTLTSNHQEAFVYDARGRQEQTSKRLVTYTEHDLPRSIETLAGQTLFSYDAAGHRVKKAGPEESLITLAGLYERHASAGAVRHVFIIPGGEGPVAERSYEEVSSIGSTEYLHRDPLGSVGAVSDQVGALLHARYYEPFGTLQDKDGDPAAVPPDDPRLGFAGHTHDEDLGLIDMQGRIYDPSLRRFLTPDPHVTDPLFGQSYNRYSYVLNNPINLIDPTGFDSESSDYATGCGDVWSCTDYEGGGLVYQGSVGGPSGDTGGSSAPDQSSGVKIASSTPKHAVRLPAGTSVASGARSGPPLQAWAERNGATGAFTKAALEDYAKTAIVTPMGSLMSLYGAGQTGLAIGQALRQGDVETAGSAAARMLPVAGTTLALRDMYWEHDWGIASSEMKAEAVAHALPLVANLVGEAVMLSAGVEEGAGAGSNIVYRGLAAGEDAAAGLVARAPNATNSAASHVAGARASQWISTTRSLEIATSRFGENGVIAIDLSLVGSEVMDLTAGIPGIGRNTMLSRWAINAQEILIQGSVPARAITPVP
jgi:RHS repeat-associated protein